ncbi:MAG: tRNA epoxyqueuosine(34) reductase QueG [Bacteroidaceae bacterium]|nr:tRNA epoxyqueuosine(34) reductase QueG [Bacteroidaceae bacterium]
MSTREQLASLIKQKASELGFHSCGIAPAKALPEDVRDRFEQWLASGCNAAMAYMAGNLEKRMNPALLVEGTKSIVVVAQNYYTDKATPFLSMYAQGKDYHKVVKDKLHLLLAYINTLTPARGRAFCDSAPVFERYLATQAGLGWCGRNRQLIIPGAGTHFFLGELFLDIELEPDTPYAENHCGNCHACIEACPGNALSEDGIDARRCLSYLTIEHRDELPEWVKEDDGNCFYGCDKCQSACPHNRFAQPHNEQQFSPTDELLSMHKDDWLNLTKEKFEALFKESAVQRCGYLQFMRNIRIKFKKY